MPKGLHALPEVPMAPNESKVAIQASLLSVLDDGSQSYFEQIESVQSGSLVVVTPDGLSSRRYWSPERRELHLKTADDYAEALRSHLDRAVSARLRGCDDHVGAHLSGGWDSSSVAATAARLIAPRGGRVIAFTATPREGYDQPAPPRKFGDESALAAATAALYPNMDHVLVRSSNRSPIDTLDQDFDLIEAPLVNPCNAVWFRAINEAARDRGLSVMLMAENGNLTLTDSGLDWPSELIAQGRWVKWFSVARALTRNGVMNWRGAVGSSFAPWIPSALWRTVDYIKGGRSHDAAFQTAVNPALFARLSRLASSTRDSLGRFGVDTFATRLELIRLEDSGNHRKGHLAESGIDIRDPTTDRRLIEFSLSTPMEQIVVEGRPRALARRALSDRLPNAVLEEKNRGYQAIDWHEGLTARRKQMAQIIEQLAACPPAARALDVPRMRRLIDEWPASGWDTPEIVSAYRLALLRGISIGHFLLRASMARS